MCIYIYIYIYEKRNSNNKNTNITNRCLALTTKQHVLCMHGRLMVLRVHTHIMGSRGYLVFRHAVMAQEDEGTLECNIGLLYFPPCPPSLFLD